MKADEKLLSLNEYALKYDVSVSTLRRRIKKDAIKYVFDDGKYWIKDINLGQQDEVIKKSPQAFAPPQKDEQQRMVKSESSRSHEPSAFVAASKILDELKSSFELNLQSKDQHINSLKEEIADLRTLVKVLEQENDRLKRLTTDDRFFETIKDNEFNF